MVRNAFRNVTSKWILIIVLCILAALAAAQTVYTVPAGSVGIISQWGAVNRVVLPGIGVKWPIAEAILLMNVRTQMRRRQAKIFNG